MHEEGMPVASRAILAQGRAGNVHVASAMSLSAEGRETKAGHADWLHRVQKIIQWRDRDGGCDKWRGAGEP
eukprot:358480-Chlamydomonas_euryale.AAC.3